MDKHEAEKLFLEELETIERAIRHAARRASMSDDAAEDFASYVNLKLIEKEYAVLRKYERRASFAAFISVVVQRLLLDFRIAQWGKWHASAEAKRMGEPAITIEVMLLRDGRSVEEVLPALRRRWPEMTQAAVQQVVQRLPKRAPRVRTVELREAHDAVQPWNREDRNVMLASEHAVVAKRIESIVRSTVQDLDEQDRLVFRLRFESAMTVAEISRMLRIEQKPLYRRIERALHLLRVRLEDAGITSSHAEAILTSNADLDFGFAVQNAMTGNSAPEKGSE